MLLWAELKKIHSAHSIENGDNPCRMSLAWSALDTVLSVVYAKVNVLYAFVSVWFQGRGQGIPMAHASNRWRVRNLTFTTEGGGI